MATCESWSGTVQWAIMITMTDSAQDSPGVAYFHRTGPSGFRATEHVGGGWDPTEQHVAPSLGLLAHVMERDMAARGHDDLHLSRISYDILGTFPIDAIELEVTALRPGRTIELLEARLRHDGRDAVIARGWFLRSYESGPWAGSPWEAIAGWEGHQVWDASTLWPGGFIRSLSTRRTDHGPGRATAWLRTDTPLLAGEDVSPTSRALGLVDAMNGMAVRADNRHVAFPNVDLTAHLFRAPIMGPGADWLGLDTTVSFGAGGWGLTHSVLHDDDGPFGVVSQALTVRPL